MGSKHRERAIHLLDVENLGHGTDCSGTALAWTLHRFEKVAEWAPDDHAVGTASSWFFKRVRFDLPAGLRLLPAGGGPDSADLRLIEEIDPSWTARRFQRVVIGSGDHIFADLARRLREAGTITWAISWSDQMSGALAQSVDVVRYLDEVPNSTTTAAVAA